MPRPMPPASGYTLIELLTTLSLVALLSGIAWPAFRQWLLDHRREASVAMTVHAAQLARQLAATRGVATFLCGSDDGTACSSRSDWTAGFLVLSEDALFRRSFQPATAGPAPRLRSNRAIIRFEAGTSFASPATISVCDRRGSAAARAVIISRSGRPRVSSRDASDGPISC